MFFVHAAWCLWGKKTGAQTSRKSFDAFSDSSDFYHLNFITVELYGSSTIGDTCWKESGVELHLYVIPKWKKQTINLTCLSYQLITAKTHQQTSHDYVVFEVLSVGIPRLVDVASCFDQPTETPKRDSVPNGCPRFLLQLKLNPCWNQLCTEDINQ